ncbi:MAG: cytochrome c3 family protein [bacterium]|nr:MAG: cytochrome c3 family protein [bacterium]
MVRNWIWVIVSVLAMIFTSPGMSRSGDTRMPSLVVIDALSHLFDAAEFDHDLHLDFAESCSECHHHTTGTDVTDGRCLPCHDGSEALDTVACGKCHVAQPFSAEYLRKRQVEGSFYHIDKPGLKAAYHLNCLQCHMEMGGPEGCQDCHTRNETGEAFYYSGRFMPAGKQSGDGH